MPAKQTGLTLQHENGQLQSIKFHREGDTYILTITESYDKDDEKSAKSISIPLSKREVGRLKVSLDPDQIIPS